MQQFYELRKKWVLLGGLYIHTGSSYRTGLPLLLLFLAFDLWPDALPLTFQFPHGVFPSIGRPLYLLLPYRRASFCLVSVSLRRPLASLSEAHADPQSDPAGGTGLYCH